MTIKRNRSFKHLFAELFWSSAEPPISTPNCKYLHGVFPDAIDCQVFHSCWGGDATRYQCGPGLAYDRRSRTCSWMDKVAECKQQRGESTRKKRYLSNLLSLKQIVTPTFSLLIIVSAQKCCMQSSSNHISINSMSIRNTDSNI